MNACVRTSPVPLDIFSLRRRLSEADIFQQLECRSEQEARDALVKEFGTDRAYYIEHEYPEIYQAYVDMVMNQVPWTSSVFKLAL
ncbi:MAG: hypothetical protein LW809_00470 [Vampirovibrionales bacterium]|jgi:hypothetical protein|nr:hypothetical protein [Vampirovibrionales bacterium]